MTVYVDDLQIHPTNRIKPAARRHGNTWCHMATDGDPELGKDEQCHSHSQPSPT